MAKIDIIHPEHDDIPPSTEVIEVRAWDLGGTDQQRFYIGSGLNFKASGNIWLEIIYSVESVQILYSRNFLHHGYDMDAARLENQLDELVQKGEGQFGFGDMLPETSLILLAEKSTYEGEDHEEQTPTYCNLEISADTGAVFGYSSPGSRSIDIKLNYIDFEDGIRFMRQLIHEIDAVFQGRHPNPADLPPGSSEWPFIWQLNRRAYNRVASSYQEGYFNNPLLADAIDNWLSQIPQGGQILDAGCGHGEPIIPHLLKKGFRVTGTDFSPEMLRRARRKFPRAKFVHQATTQLTSKTTFDGACSFSSLLYMDPIDFYHSVYRLYCAMKPGGLLFLYAFNSGPDWRGEPFRIVLGEWMWSWHYGMEEARCRLEEHGYFKVLETKRVEFNIEEELRIAQEIEKERQKKEEYLLRKADSHEQNILPYFGNLPDRPAYAYAILARRSE